MLTFTNPSALLALLGLLVPLAIHLWNRRPGREVAVGSLRWLAAGANRRMRNLRLEQLWLLLLRAALLAVLTGAIAGPVWRQPQPAGRGQVFISPDLIGKGVLTILRPRLDSLRRRGYAVRWLSRGLPLVPATAWRADSLGQPLPTTDSVALTDAAFYKQRIWLAADTFAGQPLDVLTSNRVTAMQGIQRALPPNVTWQTLPLSAKTTWLQAATATGDSLHLLLGHSTERQTTFQTARVALPRLNGTIISPGLPPLRYELTHGSQPQLRRQPTTAAPIAPPECVPVRPAGLRVWVYAPPGNAAEARYLRAALRAASVGLPGPMSLTVTPTLPDTVSAPNWLFWLSAAPVPLTWREQVLRRGVKLWQAPTSHGQADTTLLVASKLAETSPASLWRRAALLTLADAQVLWADALGRPVLTRRAVGTGAIYQSAITITPTWSTLPDNPALPALLLDVLQPAPTGADLARLRAHDQRQLDATQLPAQISGTTKLAAPPAFRRLDLRPWLVLAAGLLLALERWLAGRRAGFTSISPA